MPLHYLRRLTGKERTQAANRELAFFLAFVAGATNAGGYLAVRQYTSHMSGIVSAMADSLALGNGGLLLAGAEALASFVAGAALTAVLVNWGRRRNLQGAYAIPLVVEAGLLLVFGVIGHRWDEGTALMVPATVVLLCFTMGLQNAIITKLSNAEIRTTHVTGMVTDLGIELGKMLYFNRTQSPQQVVANWAKVRLLGSLVGSFFAGGVVGALGFKHAGFGFTVPLAFVLLILAAVPVVDDLRRKRPEPHQELN
jgi:uncharacterized membrane protein YoaK (UPF0700 family)